MHLQTWFSNAILDELEGEMSEPKNQHYLPRFYLKGFANPDVPGQLDILKKGHSHWMKRGVKSVWSQDYLYSFRDNSGKVRHDIEEDMFAKHLEPRFRNVLNKILKKQNLNDEDRFTFLISYLKHF